MGEVKQVVERKVYELWEAPWGDTYRNLVKCAIEHCVAFLLVVPRNTLADECVKDVLSRLAQFLLKESEETEWPGTKGAKPAATVYRYKFNPASATILNESAEGLFSWNLPELPEDLCFLRDDGSPWLVTISHENDVYLELSETEKTDLLAKDPDLALFNALDVGVVLSISESNVITSTLDQLSARDGNDYSLEQLMRDWSLCVARIGKGFLGSMEEYRDALYPRDILGEVLRLVPQFQGVRLKEAVEIWDARFINLTREVLLQKPSGVNSTPDKFWQVRIPKNLCSELEDDLRCILPS